MYNKRMLRTCKGIFFILPYIFCMSACMCVRVVHGSINKSFSTKLVALSITEHLSSGLKSLRIAERIDTCDMSRYNSNKLYLCIDHEVTKLFFPIFRNEGTFDSLVGLDLIVIFLFEYV